MKRMWRFLLTIFILNSFFFSTEDPIFSWWIFTLTKKGMFQGAKVVILFSVCLILGERLLKKKTPVEITRGLEKFLKPFKYIGVPVKDVAMILNISLQFIPILVEETENIKLAQMSRGADFSSRNLIKRGKSFIPLIIPIFVAAFRRADELAQAMESRS